MLWVWRGWFEQAFSQSWILCGVVLNGCGRGMWIYAVGIPSRFKAHIGSVLGSTGINVLPLRSTISYKYLSIFTNVDSSVNLEGPIFMLLNGVTNACASLIEPARPGLSLPVMMKLPYRQN